MGLSWISSGRAGARVLLALLSSLGAGGLEAALPEFDFTKAGSAVGWVAAHDLSGLQTGAEGLTALISGPDPYLIGPARDYPSGAALWLRLRLKSEQAGSCQVFYFRTNPTETDSVRLDVPAGRWVEGRVPLPALGAGYKMRLDPPGVGGRCTFAALRFELRGALPDFDFATVPDATQWGSAHDLSSIEPTLEGLLLRLSGGDPYLFGPARDYPDGKALWLRLRLRSDQGGTCQVFFFRTGATEEQSVRFTVPGGAWHEARVPLPPLGAGYRLRIDPPGTGGSCLLGWLRFEERLILQPPAWPKPSAPTIAADAVRLEAGEVTLLHNPDALGAFELRVAGRPMAAGYTQPLAGYLQGTAPRWFSLASSSTNPASVERTATGLRVTATATDPDGGHWALTQLLEPGPVPDSLALEVRVTADRDREVVYLPLLTLLPGLGAFGTNKTQGLFAGLEYLENEPSSSEADLSGPQARRQVPDALKITFPLMAIAAQDRCLGLIWSPDPNLSALFDSPDRVFGGGGHVMGLLFPGSDGVNREDGNLLPYGGQLLGAGQAFIARGLIVGSRGPSTATAIQQYVQFRGLPAVPGLGMSAVDYYRLEAAGWLESKIREGDRFRHAVAPGFNFGLQGATDAALYMDWLGGRVEDASLAQRLDTAARGAVAQVDVASYNGTQVGHVRYPLPALLYGGVLENARAALGHGRALRGRFQPDGSVLYQKPATGIDYGKTHFAPDANGLTAGVVQALLEDAAFTGDRTLIADGLRYLRALSKFRHTVPRGAQTWEIALHAPDILAAGYLVRAYTLGYELSGEADFLAQAREWAWTGLPFVYLSPPTAKPVGVYSTIPVYAATGFVAPNWMGLPVQWCGMVYADALYRLARHDANALWRQVADGITVAGIQHTYPLSDADYKGLLPDSYNLRPQTRNGPAINPATVMAGAVRLLGGTIYDFRAFLHHGLMVHAPGDLTEVQERTDGVKFRAVGWHAGPWRLLVSGVWKRPLVRLDGRETALTSPHAFSSAEGWLVLQLGGSAWVEILLPAANALNIQSQSQGRAVTVSWPAAVTDYALQWNSTLSAADSWQDSPAAVFKSGDSQYVTELTAARERFYRLRRAP